MIVTYLDDHSILCLPFLSGYWSEQVNQLHCVVERLITLDLISVDKKQIWLFPEKKNKHKILKNLISNPGFELETFYCPKENSIDLTIMARTCNRFRNDLVLRLVVPFNSDSLTVLRSQKKDA